MKNRKIIWVRIPQPLVTFIVMGFGALGLILSLQRGLPVMAVSMGKISFFQKMFSEMLEFVRMGV